MMLTKPLKMTPVERLVSGQEYEFRRVVLLEAQGWSQFDEDFVVRMWREYAESIVRAFNWTGRETRKAVMQDRLASAIVEGQLVRERHLRGEG